ncbi:MAG: DMT family transporter [Sporichthyaceae bacterium]
MAWVFLAIAIVSEVAATLGLRAAEGFSKLGWTVLVVSGYVVAFWCLAQSLQRGLNLGVAYGIWSGVGVATVAVLSRVFFDEALTLVTVLGLALIVAGVAVVELGGSAQRAG